MSVCAMAGFVALGTSFARAEETKPAAPAAESGSAAAPAATPTPATVTAPAPTPPAPAAPAPAPKSGFAAWNQKSKQITRWWKWGADLRIRDEYMKNTLTLSSSADRHQQNYLRFRARWWNVLTPAKGLDLNVRLTIESRDWTETSFSAPFHKGWDWNEVVFDYLNLRWKGGKDVPVTLSVGRQDLSFGDNWLIFEGTPLDGSRTINFDAARATFEVKKWKTTIDAIFIDQWARNDHWLPPMRIAGDAVNGVDLPVKKAQIEQNERGAVLYVTNKSKAKTEIQGYFIYKGNRREPLRVANAANAKCPNFQPAYRLTAANEADDSGMITNLCRGDSSDLYTIGSRVAGDIAPVWKFRVEAAFQTGTRNGRDQRGLGLNSAIMFVPKSKRGHQLRLAYEYLSGDKPGTTDRDEQFDILWGRWPRWSELYIYTYAPETRISQLSNLHRIGPGWTFKPFAKGTLVTDVNWLFADQNNRPVGFFSESGKTRGLLITSKLLMNLTSHMSAHLWAEHVRPGSYYAPARQDPATFLRLETILSW
jgi:hypothetical protein